MSGEIEKKDSTPSTSVENNYIETINSLKAKVDSMVTREDYDKLAKENKELLDSYLTGQKRQEEQATPKDSKKELNTLFHKATHAESDLDGYQAMLDYADLFEQVYGYDPLVGQDPHNPPTQGDYDDSKNARAYIRDCIEKSNGDSDVFKTLMVSNMTGFKIQPKGVKK